MKKNNANFVILSVKETLQFILSSSAIGVLILFLIHIVKFKIIQQSGFPLGDGGMFYTLVTDLSATNLSFPQFVSYNLSQIPFTYPPLAFYIYASIAKIFSIPVSPMLMYGPFLCYTLAMIALYAFSSIITQSKKNAYLSVLLFSLNPDTFEWIIFGGGVTRAMGMFFSLITLFYGYKFFVQQKANIYLLSALISCTALSHTEWFIFTIIGLMLITLFYSPKKTRALIRYCVVVCVSCIFILPWLLIVLNIHGITPFMAATKSNESGYSNIILRLIAMHFSTNLLFTPVQWIALLGLFSSLQQKKWFIPVFLVLILLFYFRAEHKYISILISILAAIGITTVIIPSFPSRAMRYLLLSTIVIICFLFMMQYIYSHWSFPALSKYQRSAMGWIKVSTPKNAQFLVISPEYNWGIDKVSEWFPALTERHSVATVQGSEWLPDNVYSKKRLLSLALKACNTKGLTCVEKLMQQNHIAFDYMYISIEGFNDYNPKTIFNDITKSSSYELVYHNTYVWIWRKR